MADLMWSIHLYRLSWAGLARLWNEFPRVTEYARQAYERPSFRTAVAEWPGIPPTDHIPEHATMNAKLRFAWGMLTETNWREVALG